MSAGGRRENVEPERRLDHEALAARRRSRLCSLPSLSATLVAKDGGVLPPFLYVWQFGLLCESCIAMLSRAGSETQI